MREILFRGKQKYSEGEYGEWVYGNLCQNIYGEWVIQRIDDFPCKVIAENTIGQYTGLTDKNGTKIFEGDILSSEWGYKGEVGLFSIGYAFMECLFDEDCEVIGNIYDNPELLKGGV